MARFIIFLILAIFYAIFPFDLLPDGMGKIGRVDDLLITFIFIWWFFFRPLYNEIKHKTSSKSTCNTGSSSSDFEKQDPYVILGISTSATDEEIKKAYLDKIKEYHPDLVNKMGTRNTGNS